VPRLSPRVGPPSGAPRPRDPARVHPSSRRHGSLFPLEQAPVLARRWRAADGGTCRQRPTAEESPHFGEHGVGWEPDGRESELRSSNDTARWYGDGAAPEVPPGPDETAVSPEASPDRRCEEFPRPPRRARSRMLPEPEWGLLPRPGRPVRNGGPLLPLNRRIRGPTPSGSYGPRDLPRPRTRISPAKAQPFGPPPTKQRLS